MRTGRKMCCGRCKVYTLETGSYRAVNPTAHIQTADKAHTRQPQIRNQKLNETSELASSLSACPTLPIYLMSQGGQGYFGICGYALGPCHLVIRAY